MAVVKNFWLRDNKQKLGGAVIYQANGQTLMRQLAPSVSNPRTDAQMETRVKLANLVAFYRASAGWMRGAFETKPNNQSDYNAFVSANATANNVWLTKSQVDAGNAIVAPYVVSRGSLGEITQNLLQEFVRTNIYVGTLQISANTTVAQFTEDILANNNGILEGDQISFIQYIQNASTDGNYTVVCRSYEVILSLTSSRLLSDFLPIDIIDTSEDANRALGAIVNSFVGGVAFVLSRTYNGRILVSTSRVTLTLNNTVYSLMTQSSQKNTAIRSYGSSTIVFLDSNMADASNSQVSTSAQILSIKIGNKNYAPGDYIKRSYEDEEQIVVTLSASINVPQNTFLVFTNPYNDYSISFDRIPTTAGSGNVFTFSCSAPGEIPEGQTVTAIIGTATQTLVQTTFETPGDGNGEGLS